MEFIDLILTALFKKWVIMLKENKKGFLFRILAIN